MQEEFVAGYIEQAHLETSILQYNDENALSYTLSLAYYVARNDYTIIRELPTGKGLEHYLDRLLLVAVTYDKKTKKHSCKIEMYQSER